MNTVTRTMLLLLALAAGFWLRWDGLDWGRGSTTPFHPDEPRFTEQADALDRGLPLRKSYVFGFGQAIRAVHAAAPSLDHARIARGLSLGAGMALCLVVFAIARALNMDAGTAALAAALTALNTLCVIHSHFGTADMAYTLLLHLFALAALRGWLLGAAAAAGFAMATKFGLILLPSLCLLGCLPATRLTATRLKPALRLPLVLAIAGFVFQAAQGFTFDRESIRMISLSARVDNLEAFEHQKWQNIITYAGVAIRALGIPVFVFAVVGLVRAGRTARSGGIPAAVWIALLPLALHALGLLAVNTSFPRHFLPLVPLPLIAAAHGIAGVPRLRVVFATLCLGWSALLAWSDGRVFAGDPREAARRAVPRPDVLLVQEARVWRFERSEINPLRAPGGRELYHATADELRQFRDFKAAVARGEWRMIFEDGPSLCLPEQRLYDAAWGSFEKFAGKCTVYERVAPRDPITGESAP